MKEISKLGTCRTALLWNESSLYQYIQTFITTDLRLNLLHAACEVSEDILLLVDV